MGFEDLGPGKARKRRNMRIFQVFATQPGGMHRCSKCEVIFVRVLRAALGLAPSLFVTLMRVSVIPKQSL